MPIFDQSWHAWLHGRWLKANGKSQSERLPPHPIDPSCLQLRGKSNLSHSFNGTMRSTVMSWILRPHDVCAKTVNMLINELPAFETLQQSCLESVLRILQLHGKTLLPVVQGGMGCLILRIAHLHGRKPFYWSVFLRFVQVQLYSLALGTIECNPSVVTVKPDWLNSVGLSFWRPMICVLDQIRQVVLICWILTDEMG